MKASLTITHMIALCLAAGLVAQSAMLPSHPLGPGDEVEINVDGEATLSGPFTIVQQGIITYPLLQQIDALGLTVQELAQTIRKRLIEEGYMLNPEVTARITHSHSKTVAVSGAVRDPGAYPLPPDSRLDSLLSELDVLPEAGPRLLVRRKLAHGTKSEFTELVIERGRLSPGASSTHVFNVTLHPSDAIYVETLEPVRLVHAGKMEVVGLGPHSRKELREILANVTPQASLRNANVAVVDRIGQRVEVWYANARDVLLEDPRAQRELWPGNICFILPPGTVGLAPSNGDPRVVDSGSVEAGSYLQTFVNTDSDNQQSLRWYPLENGSRWIEYDNTRPTPKPGILVGVSHPAETM